MSTGLITHVGSNVILHTIFGMRYLPLDLVPQNMLITKAHYDLPTKLHGNENKIRIFVLSPNVPDYPLAKFPGLCQRQC